MVKPVHVVVLGLLVVFSSACGANRNKAIRRMAAQDLGCPEGQVSVSTLNKSELQFLANACGRRAVYTWTKQSGALRVSAIEGTNVLSPTNDPNAPPPPPPPPSGGATSSAPRPPSDAPPPPPPPPPAPPPSR